jgi:hypothetical protein
MSKLAKSLMMGAAGAAGENLYIEDVFSTYLYTGNSSTQTITNEIDLAGEGGLVWTKIRSISSSHILVDTVRGGNTHLRTNNTDGNGYSYSYTFNSNGYTIGTDSQDVNESTRTYASWTFRKAEKFFDIVTYTGDGTAGRTVSHNLGSVPGCIIVKRTDSVSDWQVYHKALGETFHLFLNDTQPEIGPSGRWDSTAPTSAVFSLGGSGENVNDSGGTYVAYLFAHDAGGFGDDGTESVIKCGSFTGANISVDLGWEPQFLLAKRTDSTSNWFLVDNMRGFLVGTDSLNLSPNLSISENTTWFSLTNTGFQYTSSSATYIYIAIRRGPMKTPEDATEVFGVTAASNEPSSTSPGPTLNSQSGVLADLIFHRPRRTDSNSFHAASRLQGADKYMVTTQTTAESSAEGTFGGFWKFDNNEYAYIPGPGLYNNTTIGTPYVVNSFRRAPGFFDVVAWTGSATSTGQARYINHNLSAPVDLIIIKNRSSGVWIVQVSPLVTGNNHYTLNLNNGNSAFSDLTFSLSSTSFVVTTFQFAGYQPYNTDTNGQNYIAYLFGSLPGVSKVGMYTGTGTTQDIDCGFTSGARFVLIKRLDPVVTLASTPPSSVGDWYVWDTARGIVSGDDPYLLLNSTAAEVTNTDYIDPLSSGFQISSSAPAALNADGGSYIFLAIA